MGLWKNNSPREKMGIGGLVSHLISASPSSSGAFFIDKKRLKVESRLQTSWCLFFYLCLYCPRYFKNCDTHICKKKIWQKSLGGYSIFWELLEFLKALSILQFACKKIYKNVKLVKHKWARHHVEERCRNDY